MLRLTVTALIAGTVLGLYSVVGDRLPGDTPLHVIVAMANAAGPWLATAFGVGALQRSQLWGAAAATASLIVAVVVYYLGIYAAGNEVSNVTRAVGAWLVVAIVVGPILGASGSAWSSPTRHRVVGASLLAGALLAEAAFRLVQVEAWTGIDLARSDIQVGLIDAAGGLLVPVLLLEPGERTRGYITSLLFGAAGALLAAGVTVGVRGVIAG